MGRGFGDDKETVGRGKTSEWVITKGKRKNDKRERISAPTGVISAICVSIPGRVKRAGLDWIFVYVFRDHLEACEQEGRICKLYKSSVSGPDGAPFSFSFCGTACHGRGAVVYHLSIHASISSSTVRRSWSRRVCGKEGNHASTTPPPLVSDLAWRTLRLPWRFQNSTGRGRLQINLPLDV